MTAGLPDGLLVAYYGDDFTGSTDAMEAMTAAGIPTVLFLGTPDRQALARFPEMRCVGIAGSSRGRSPQWMETELPKVFNALVDLGAPILHYKVCSTFDSSPNIGSIGKAIDLGVETMRGRWSPTIVGSPRLKRYQVFGNLFATVDSVGYRLDRHPTMSRHPITPMDEADLRLHLSRQTSRAIELIDIVQLRSFDAESRVRRLQNEQVPVVLIDVLDQETLQKAGRLVWEHRGQGIFSASSSGLQYALTAYWRSEGWIPKEHSLPAARSVEVIAGVSGSCSPVTASQVRWARDNGFHTERLRLERILDVNTRGSEITRASRVAADALHGGRSAIVFSAEGPDDSAVITFDRIAADVGLSRQDAARTVGVALADVMRSILNKVQLQRVLVAGGDSSGEVASALEIDALTVAADLAPGAPLCRAWSRRPERDGLEIVLKGGQMGGPEFFGLVKAGGASGN